MVESGTTQTCNSAKTINPNPVNPGDDEESEEEEGRLFGQITVEIEPIQLIA